MIILGTATAGVAVYFGAPWWLSAMLGLLVAWSELTALARWLAVFSLVAIGAGHWLAAPWWLVGAVVVVVGAVAIYRTLEDCRMIADAASPSAYP